MSRPTTAFVRATAVEDAAVDDAIAAAMVAVVLAEGPLPHRHPTEQPPPHPHQGDPATHSLAASHGSPPGSVAASQHANPSTTVRNSSNRLEEHRHAPGIFTVTSVAAGGPAALAGLAKHDIVIQFGSVVASEIASVSDLVRREEGHLIRVIVKRVTPDASRRAWTLLEVGLVPQRWGGPGLLGCVLDASSTPSSASASSS